jgi:hypothetical protein
MIKKPIVIKSIKDVKKLEKIINNDSLFWKLINKYSDDEIKKGAQSI